MTKWESTYGTARDYWWRNDGGLLQLGEGSEGDGNVGFTFNTASNMLGVGTTAPAQAITIKHSEPTILFIHDSTEIGFIGDCANFLTGSSPASDSFGVRSTGDFRIGTGGNNLRMTIASGGNATFTGAVSITNTADDSIWKSAMTGEGSSHRGEFIHSYSDTASSGGTETTMYAWYKLKAPIGYSGAGIARVWEITMIGAGAHAANSVVNKYIVVESNGNHTSSGNLNGVQVDLIYKRTSTSSNTYGGSLSASFYYKNNASHNNGELYMRLSSAFREPAITVHIKTLGCVRQGSTYGAGNGTDVEFLGAHTSSSTNDPGSNTEITVNDVGADLTN